MNEKQEIYDELCRVLTDYESGDFESAADATDALYEMLVKIQNRWEDVFRPNEILLIKARDLL